MIEVYGPPLAPPVEYARWTLARTKRAYQFQPAAAGISAFRSWRNRVPIELPLIFVDGKPYGGFRESFALLHGPLNASLKMPLPVPDAAFAETLFSDLFGPCVRCFYRTMLDHPTLLKPLATQGVPMLHAWIIRGFYPLWRWVMRKGLKLDVTEARTDQAAIDAVFSDVAKRLGSSSFLGGEAPDENDYLFAVCASPVILPPGHPVSLPDVHSLAEPLRASITAYRKTVAGKLALRTYLYRS